jgi:ketol-acid reductoisomerase
MTSVEGSAMWSVGAEVRRTLRGRHVPVDPFTAGTFAGAMVAQVDVLHEAGHPWSEIANESVIEAVDSLLPYMHARGVAYMIDNCSTTARLGARKWGPRFEADLSRFAYPEADGRAEDGDATAGAFGAFRDHPLHDVLDTLRAFRPPVDIAVA